MSEFQIRQPRIHRLKREQVVQLPVVIDVLELVTKELSYGMADRTKRRYRLHCLNPSLMTRTTVIALDRLSEKLRLRSADFYALRIEEI